VTRGEVALYRSLECPGRQFVSHLTPLVVPNMRCLAGLRGD
jgi:hypothetical protein